MQIIPVIDLKNGIVVHAKQGNRDDYAALESKICKSSDIFDVINAFSSLFRSPIIYIADLNAITGQGNHVNLLNDVLTAFPNIHFWIDSGYPLPNNVLQLANYLPVLGSESFKDENVIELKHLNHDFILSLDYALAGELGAKSLFRNADLWPKHLIIMNLPKVGSNQGPDIERLMRFRQHYPQHNFIAAGGIRNREDLKKLEQIGIQQALLATALHNGQIS
jgi:phosphoribosylformimino-5-aminoimidazole carboxamide ribotide isomerase